MPTIKLLFCKQCGAERKIGRRLCSACNVKRVLQYPRHRWIKICEVCNQEYAAWRKKQIICKECYSLQQEIKAKSINTNNYQHTKKAGKHEHRDIVEQLIGRTLLPNEVIHHLDDNPKNNAVTNLILLSRSKHGQLHLFLDLQRLKLEKTDIEKQR